MNDLVHVGGNGQARLIITWQGNQGELPQAIPMGMGDNEILAIAAEAIRNGDVPGIPADPNVRFTGYKVDRPPVGAGMNMPHVFVRNDTAFGSLG